MTPKIIDTRKPGILPVMKDHRRPFLVLIGSTAKGHYASKSEAVQRIRELGDQSCRD